MHNRVRSGLYFTTLAGANVVLLLGCGCAYARRLDSEAESAYEAGAENKEKTRAIACIKSKVRLACIC